MLNKRTDDDGHRRTTGGSYPLPHSPMASGPRIPATQPCNPDPSRCLTSNLLVIGSPVLRNTRFLNTHLRDPTSNVRTMVRYNALFALAVASTAVVSNAGEYKIRIRNLTWMQPFSPPLVVAHTTDVSIFKEGTVASDALQLVAENGDLSGLLMLAQDDDVRPFICGAVVADTMVFGGDTWRGYMYVDDDLCGDSPVFSVVSMLVNTNDAFVGIDSEDLVTTGASKSYPPAFDAGTEENYELCAYIPGPACADVPGNLAAGDGEGYVHIHRGVHGIGNLTASVFDWRNPVAEVSVFAP